MSSPASRRLALFVSALSLMSAAPLAFAAQTTIKLKRPGNVGNCIATTTSEDGVHLDTGSTQLIVDDVDLKEDPNNSPNSRACQPVGGSSADFQLSNVTVSKNPDGTVTSFAPTIDTPFYVNWSVSADATTCVRTGSANITATSMTGWTIGESVSSPAGLHHDAVTPRQGGSYTFGVVCTNATGSKNGTAPTVPAAAPAPAPVLSANPNTALVGGSFTVTWSPMTNAASCIGTATKNSDSTPLPLTNWTTAFDPVAAGYARTLAIPAGFVAGDVLKLSLSCTNGDASASVSSASPATVTVSNTAPIPVTLGVTPSPVTAGTGTSVTVSSTQTFADGLSCIGTVNGSTTNTAWPNWSGVTIAASVGAKISKTFALPAGATAGAYTLGLTSCSPSATVTAATLTVNAATVTACPATIPANDDALAGVADKAARIRLASADVTYGATNPSVRNVQFTEFANLWGYSDTVTSTPVPWPGVLGSTPGFSMARNGYFGLYFETPQLPTLPSRQNGYFSYSTYGGTDPISVSISEKCGDFSGNPALNACYGNNVLSDDNASMIWSYDTTSQQPVSKYRCYLKPNTKYYINVMFTSTSIPAHNKCSAAATTGKCHITYVAR